MPLSVFETALNATTWTEVLNGGGYVSFDIVEDNIPTTVEIYLNDSATPPGAGDKGTRIRPYNSGYDFTASGMDKGVQRIWARGDTTIRGVRE